MTRIDEEMKEYVEGISAVLREMQTLVDSNGTYGIAAILLLAAGLQREHPEGVEMANNILALVELADE